MQYRIGLRKLSIQDANQLYMIYADEEVSKYRGSNAMKSIKDALIFIQNDERIEGEVLTIRQGVELLKENKIIGSVMIRMNKKNEYEIGYSIGRKFWRQGFGTEIIKLLLKKTQENKEIENVVAWCHMDNTASIKILKKNKFCLVVNNLTKKNYPYLKYLNKTTGNKV